MKMLTKNIALAILVFVVMLFLLKIFLESFAFQHLSSKPQIQNQSQNSARLLINGIQSSAQRVRNLEDAGVVMIKTFEFHDDFSGNQLLAKLDKLAKKGAFIFIQFDVKGIDTYERDFSDIYHQKLSPIPLFIDKLNHKYPHRVYVFPTNVPHHLSEYLFDKLGIHFPVDHEKYFITWSEKNKAPVRVVLGGMNIGDAYLQGGALVKKGKVFFKQENGQYPWRDTDIELTGPVTKLIVERFLQEAEYQSLNSRPYLNENLQLSMQEGLKKLHRIVNDMNIAKSAFVPDLKQGVKVKASYFFKNIFTNDIERDLILKLKRLPNRESVTLVSPYFLPSNKLQEAILEASQRGIRFTILSNSSRSSVTNFSKIAKISHTRMRYLWQNSPKNSIKFYEYLGSSSLGLANMHQKVWLLGNNKNAAFAIGSSNLDSHSLRINSEDMVWLQSPSLRKEVDRMIKKDLSDKTSQEIPCDLIFKEGWIERFKEYTLDLFFSSII